MDLKERTKLFSFRIKDLIKKAKVDFVKSEILKQLLRSGMSVGANTRAAYRGRSKKEFIAKIGIVIEEADECTFWLELLQDEAEHLKDEIIALKKEASEIVAIFISIRKKSQ